MTKLIPPWVWLLVAAGIFAAGFGLGYHRGSVKWQVKLGVAEAAWASREKTYTTNEATAVKNEAELRRALGESQKGLVAIALAAADAVKQRDHAIANAAKADEARRALIAAQDAEPRPPTCDAAFVTVARHFAELNATLPPLEAAPP